MMNFSPPYSPFTSTQFFRSIYLRPCDNFPSFQWSLGHASRNFYLRLLLGLSGLTPLFVQHGYLGSKPYVAIMLDNSDASRILVFPFTPVIFRPLFSHYYFEPGTGINTSIFFPQLKAPPQVIP